MTRAMPTMLAYLDWARAQGCAIEIHDERDGPILRAITIRAPSGLQVTEIFAALDDPLMSTTVARLDRRLGMKSWLFR